MPEITSEKPIDPINFEVLKNRLWAINDEQANIALRASGSLIIYDCRDFNTAITDSEGNGLFLGSFNSLLGISIAGGIKWILANYGRDYINEGDMLLFNDPWVGAVHANDYVLVAPVFYQGDIVAWAGVCMHEVDVGSPVPGSFVVGAKDAYDEAPLVPPIKIVNRGEVQKDLVRLLARVSRLPEMIRIDMMARVSAVRATQDRIGELVERYGKATFIQFTKQLIEYSRDIVSDRLRELPDGTWYDRTYQDHDGINNIIYLAQLAMSKKGSKLLLDFSGTSEQAPGLINCTWSGLHGGIASTLFPMLFYGLPWSSAALEQLYEVKAEEGTQINARYPAAVSMGSIAGAWIVRQLVTTCTGKMLASSEKFKEQAFADYCPPWLTVIFSGLDQEGRPFTTLAMDSSGGGTGARTYRDGIDSGGGLDIPGMSMADVEMEEYNSPILVLWRKEVRDTFGAGKFRGGVGVEWAKIPHKNPQAIQCVIAATSMAMPGASGICGGLPCSTQFAAIARNTEVRKLLKSGKVPSDLSEVGGEVQIMLAKSSTKMDKDDLQFAVRGGGGGYGDPLDRDPEIVEKDIKDGLCSIDMAIDIFGVVVEPGSSSVDKAATEKRREEIRQQRLKEGKSVHQILGRGKR